VHSVSFRFQFCCINFTWLCSYSFRYWRRSRYRCMCARQRNISLHWIVSACLPSHNLVLRQGLASLDFPEPLPYSSFFLLSALPSELLVYMAANMCMIHLLSMHILALIVVSALWTFLPCLLFPTSDSFFSCLQALSGAYDLFGYYGWLVGIWGLLNRTYSMGHSDWVVSLETILNANNVEAN